MDKNKDVIHYLIALLKEYGIKNIVASPGMQNARFNAIVQNDEFFNCYSVVDERGAAYVATGIAYETQEPVVITCTGATASRNYLSALTEAYYRKIPVIAITFFNPDSNQYSLSPQYVDRSISQNDIKYVSVELPKTLDVSGKKRCLTYLNAAIISAKYNKLPVHINCPALHDYKNIDMNLPTDIWSSKVYSTNFEFLTKDFNDKKIAVFIGSHMQFSKEEENAISKFAQSWGIPVICDHVSNYHGANKILVSQISYNMKNITAPDIIIDMGGLSGEYSSASLFTKAKVWRISPDNKFINRSNYSIENLFMCREHYFFQTMKNSSQIDSGYYTYLKSMCKDTASVDLPLSNGLICQKLAKYIPQNSSLHLSILNSLRNMNFFDLDESIDVNCNVGGFGIDGAVSTLVGQSLVNRNKLCFGIIGDLAFFYDMNIIGNRHITYNIRILLVNNNRGEEFRLNPTLENNLGEQVDTLIAASGHHNGGAKGWAESCGFRYIKADTKEDFESQIKDFCTSKSEQPILFEVFTTDEDEKNGLCLLKTGNVSSIKKEKVTLVDKIGKILCGKKRKK